MTRSVFVENVIIVNEDEFARKKEAFKKAGINSLQIVSDFDRTLSKAFILGRKSNTSYAQIRESDYLPKEYQDRANALFAHYRPIEISPEISQEDKKRLMVEWFTMHLDLFVEYRLKKSVIDDIVDKGKVVGRNGLVDVFHFAKSNDVPIVIISSGIGNIINKFLSSQDLLFDSVFIVANMLNFGEEGRAFSHNDLVIAPFNKHEAEIKEKPFFEKLVKRKNILLLGDELDDIQMISGIEFDNLIKIAFFNDKIDDQLIKSGARDFDAKKDLEEYKKDFDVLILNDGSLDFVNSLLKELFE